MSRLAVKSVQRAVSTLVLTGSQLNRIQVDLDVMREVARGDGRAPLLDEVTERPGPPASSPAHGGHAHDDR
jgi:hypothetical protein